MANMFDVTPAGGDLQAGLTGLGRVIAATREKDKEEAAIQKAKDEQAAGLTALAGAYRSGDPLKVAEVGINHPTVMNQANAAIGLINDSRKKQFTDDALAVLSNPERAAQIAQDRVTMLKAQGRDSTHTESFLQHYAQDPEGAIKELKMELAVNNGPAYQAWHEMNTPKLIEHDPNKALVDPSGKEIIPAKQAQEREVRNDANGVPRYVDSGEPVFPNAPKAAKEREVRADANNVPRYVDTGELVFPSVTKTQAPPTADQSKAALFAQRAIDSSPTIEKFAQEFSKVSSAAGKVLPEMLKGEDRKLFDQASRDFINAVLRRESGAAISQSEFDSANLQYLPQPGDSKAVLAQKKRNRETVAAGLKGEAAGALGALQKNLPQTIGRFTIEEIP